MTIKTTRWGPDTCGCSIEYTWDDAVPNTERVHEWSATPETCPEHGAMSGEALYGVIVDENSRKNLTLEIIRQSVAGFTTRDYLWSFDASRVLVVDLKGQPVGVKNAIRAAADIQFEAGKVVIQ